ncbi:MAG TPA: hypothetical protein VMR16_03930 [Candidatus Saccharimonadales bacterium]|nr:hypothetical protein [Candidatus Saccharimonadales bacterium]
MSKSFKVVTDNLDRIDYFTPANFPNTHLYPGELEREIDGILRIIFNGNECDLYPNGCVIHPDVDFIDYARLDSAVILGKGTTFTHKPSNMNDFVEIGKQARVEGTVFGAKVKIGKFAVVLAQYVGNDSKIGEEAEIFSDVIIGNSVGIDVKSVIGKGVIIGNSARLGNKTNVGDGATIGVHATVGSFKGSRAEVAKQGGTFVPVGETVPSYAHI